MIVVLPWKKPPLTLNQRIHWAKKAKLTKEIRQTGRLLLRNHPPANHIEVALTWVVTDKRRRDADNTIATLKALCDGIVDAGIVPDDTPDLMTKHMPRIVYDPDANQHMQLEIWATP